MLIMRMLCVSRPLALGLGLLLFSSFSPVGAAARSITGVCPDGSLYIVQQASQVPCPDSKQVNPHDVPPMRPEYRPRPYTWDVWNQTSDPNNPYNLIDSAREVREFQRALPGADAGPTQGQVAPGQPGGGAPAVSAAPPGPVGPLDLGLSDQEMRDLFKIVEISQEHAPAHVARRTADGKGVFEVSFAHSAAFEGMLRRLWSSRGGLGQGPVVLFTAQSKRPESFYANFTVLQGHLSYQPNAEDARQLGILQGRLGDLEGGEFVLGYVVLPEAIELADEVDFYWNDRRISTRLGARRAAQR